MTPSRNLSCYWSSDAFGIVPNIEQNENTSVRFCCCLCFSMTNFYVEISSCLLRCSRRSTHYNLSHIELDGDDGPLLFRSCRHGAFFLFWKLFGSMVTDAETMVTHNQCTRNFRKYQRSLSIAYVESVTRSIQTNKNYLSITCLSRSWQHETGSRRNCAEPSIIQQTETPIFAFSIFPSSQRWHGVMDRDSNFLW